MKEKFSLIFLLDCKT